MCSIIIEQSFWGWSSNALNVVTVDLQDYEEWLIKKNRNYSVATLVQQQKEGNPILQIDNFRPLI